MSEILAFVTFHLKQVGLDNKMLNGGIVLTGGGSQLKHLIQLTEYATGLNARIGYPNEHLAPNQITELEKPAYATCIGLILKGYNIHENNQNRLNPPANKMKTPETAEVNESDDATVIRPVSTKGRKTLSDFMNSIKDGLIDLFKEEGDKQL
jgi:cell division protein FtsA